MSSHQWRVLRHLLSSSSLSAELDKLLQKVKPLAASPEQFDNVMKKLESAVRTRLYGQPHTQAQTDTQSHTLAASTTIQQQAQVEKKTEEQPSTLPVPAPAPPSPATPPPPALGEAEPPPSHVMDLSLERLWQGLRLKKDLTLGNVSRPKWKANKELASNTSIQARTMHVVRALDDVRSAASAARRCADLAEHLLQHPAARALAARRGALAALLRVQRAYRGDGDVQPAVREALALAGWSPAPRAPGPRVLAIDGGGVRGIVAIEILRELEAITGKRTKELFDFIVGVSTGAIIAAIVAGDAGTLDEAALLYKSLAREMFADTSVIGGASRLVWTRAYYDTARWERMLRARLGEGTMTGVARGEGPSLALVSARGSGKHLAPYVFRSYSGAPRRRPALAGGAGARVWEAVRASAAAPTYFEELQLDGAQHTDGGLLVNNPAGVAVLETRLQFGSLRRAVLVSVGTGRPPRPPAPPPAPAGWRDRFEAVLESATDTEKVHLLLSELLPAGTYYRLNPALTAPCAMDEIREEVLSTVVSDTRLYLRRNKDKVRAAAEALTRPRSVVQRVGDELHTRAVRLGLTEP